MTSQGETALDQLTSLAMNVYFEARGEPRIGQVAVALVTMNRVGDSRWPSTVHEVVWQDTNPLKAGGEQFSWTLLYTNEFEAMDAVADSVAYKEALSVAMEVLENYVEGDYDFTFGANLYHADYVKPYWRHHPRVTKTAEIGMHLFYREDK